MITQIAEQLRKLLLMLSSDQDGEVLAAARAIGHAPQASGSEWHALAGRFLVPTRTQTRNPRNKGSVEIYMRLRSAS